MSTVSPHSVGPGIRVAVLVEGESDRLAVETLAIRLGQDLSADGVEIVVMNGVTNTRTIAGELLRAAPAITLAGLYDAPEADKVRGGLVGAGVVTEVEISGLRDAGFFACTVDLEDELIRAVGLDGVEAVIDSEGETHSLRLLAGMPAQQGWSRDAVIRRFLTSQAGRKARYARRLSEEVDLDHAPSPIVDLLAHVRARR